ncbi:hypothetical protein MUP35_00305 [Patescibacteria group bacterium]|nr:hypothetical protein [Patescibacteria group bacterium]
MASFGKGEEDFRLDEEDYSLCGSEGGCKHCGGTGIVNKQNGSVEDCPYCLLDDEKGEEDEER